MTKPYSASGLCNPTHLSANNDGHTVYAQAIKLDLVFIQMAFCWKYHENG